MSAPILGPAITAPGQLVLGAPVHGPSSSPGPGVIVTSELGASRSSALAHQCIAAANLSGHCVVMPVSATDVDYADNTTWPHARAPLWLTMGAALLGTEVTVLGSGVIVEPSWSLSVGPVYLGHNGLLTQTPPTALLGALFLAVVGFALNATTLQFNPQPAIALS